MKKQNSNNSKPYQSLRRQQLSAVTNLPQSVSAGPIMRHQLSSSYLSTYFPHNMERICDVANSRYIISGIMALPQKGLMLESALAALTCIFLGKNRKEKHVFQYGLRLYNTAIHYMANSISRRACSDDIVYTCVVFLQIQTHYCPYSLAEWYSHIDGLSPIIKAYRPQRSSTPIMASIYGQYSKVKVLLAGLMHLSEEAITWINNEDEAEDLLLQEWMHILAEISRIAAAIEATDSSDHIACNYLLADCLSLEKQNKDALRRIRGEEEPPTFAPGDLNSGIPSTDRLFGPAYRFSSLYEANLHIFFWMTLSFIYPLIRQCRIILASPDGDDDSPHCANHFTGDEAHRLSMACLAKAARCLPYCGQEGMNPWGIHYGVFAATLVSRVYAHAGDRERFAWGLDVLAYMEASGFENAARFREIWHGYWHTSIISTGWWIIDSCQRVWERDLSGANDTIT